MTSESGFYLYSMGGPSLNLTQQVTQSLGVSIATGVLAVNEAIPTEKALCDQYGVSRIVIREVVKILTAKGLLLGRMSKGTFVTSERHWNLFDRDVLSWMQERELTQGLLDEYAEVRRAIEPASSVLASRKASSASLAKLESTLQALLAEREKQNPNYCLEADFHVALVEASENKFYRQFRNLVFVAVQAQQAYRRITMKSQQVDTRLYLKLVNAISMGRSVEAKLLTMEVLQKIDQSV